MAGATISLCRRCAASYADVCILASGRGCLRHAVARMTRELLLLPRPARSMCKQDETAHIPSPLVKHERVSGLTISSLPLSSYDDTQTYADLTLTRAEVFRVGLRIVCNSPRRRKAPRGGIVSVALFIRR